MADLQRRLEVDPVLVCLRCGAHTPYDRLSSRCPRCDHDMLDVRYDYAAIGRQWPALLRERRFDMWRYLELLPLRDPAHIVSMGEGGTPLLPVGNLGLMLGRSRVFVKDERQGPTGSFKDRQASLAISAMKEAGVTECVVASTGNVAISYSAYCARAGIKLWAFLTSMVPVDKMREVALYGTEVVKVTSTYDQAKQVAATFAEHRRLFLDRGLRSIAARESMKTLAFEVAEQLAQADAASGRGSPDNRSPFRVPDWYIQAVSGGLGPLGVWKGFSELKQMGFVDRLPKIAVIQPEGCAPMPRAFKAGKDVADVVRDPQTHIATLATGDPGAAYSLLRAIVLEHGGTMETVSDDEAFRAMHVLAKMEGISVEPAAGVAFAGLFKLIELGLVGRDEDVVVNCSGHTFPVSQELLGDEWARSFDVPQPAVAAASLPQEGLLSALERLDERVNRILIADDSPDARQLLRRILQARRNYTLTEAATGRETLDRAAADRPDLILLDLMMPEMDGFAVLEALKRSEALREIPVIVVTAKELTLHERQRLAGQAESLLQKGSFTDLDLLDELVDVLT